MSSVRIQLSYVGDGGLDVSLRASDVRGRKRTISLHSVAGSGELSIDAPLAHFVDGGAMWLEFVATKGSVVVSGVSWTVSAPEFIRPAAVVICTFNRADDCVETVATMASDAGAMTGIDAVCVVDQGTDQVQSRDRFKTVAHDLGQEVDLSDTAESWWRGWFLAWNARNHFLVRF